MKIQIGVPSYISLPNEQGQILNDEEKTKRSQKRTIGKAPIDSTGLSDIEREFCGLENYDEQNRTANNQRDQRADPQ